MDLRKYKPSKRVDDRRKQNGTTTVGQIASAFATAAKNSLEPEQLASNARIVFGSKLDAETARKSVKYPDGKLRRRPVLAGNDS